MGFLFWPKLHIDFSVRDKLAKFPCINLATIRSPDRRADHIRYLKQLILS